VAEVVTLEFLAAQQGRMLDEMALMRDDIRVPTPIDRRSERSGRPLPSAVQAF
jgi:hypothetical protein